MKVHKVIKKAGENTWFAFVPHKKHNNVPHILQPRFLIVLFVLVDALFLFSQFNTKIIRTLNLTAMVYPSVLADMANTDRANLGISQLVWSDNLATAAKLKADDMLENSYFAHTSPAGITPWYWLKKVNYVFVYAGENLAVDFTESANVQKAWNNSPKHHENIVDPRFTEIGIATTDGVFEGKNTTFVVEYFGTPVKTAVKTEVKEASTIEDSGQNNVAGAFVQEKPITEKAQNISIVKEDGNLIIAENKDIEPQKAIDDVKQPIEPIQISSWSKRFAANPNETTKDIFRILSGIILVSMTLMVTKEYEKHHKKHFLMGSALTTVIILMFFALSHFSNSALAFIG